MNSELRRLADAGCRVIQIEEPLLHFVAATLARRRDHLDFLVDCFNHEIEGLEDVEVWIHTCWGNANMQRVPGTTSYAEVIEIFLDRVGGDVWTVEMKDRSFADLELFRPYRDRMRKKIALGVVSHRSLQVESPEEVAGGHPLRAEPPRPGEADPHLRLRLRAGRTEPAGRLLQGRGDRAGREHRAARARASSRGGSGPPTPTPGRRARDVARPEGLSPPRPVDR